MSVLNVLLVEDNPGDAFLVEELLSFDPEHQFKITNCGTLKETLAALQNHNFDIILLDLGLPDSVGLNGLETLVNRNLSVPVVVITGLNDDKTGRKAVNIGAQGYLVKDELNSRLIVQTILYSIERFDHLVKLENQKLELNEKNKQLNEANSAKDLLLSVISHDVRGPVNSIISLLEILETDFDNISNAVKKKYIQGILISARSTRHLMENLLEWAKTQTNRQTINPENLNLKPLLLQNIEIVQLASDKKFISIKTEIPEQVTIYADKQMVKTVIRNLLSNAIKFTPQKGEIIVSVSAAENGKVAVVIKDSGVGIDPKKLDAIFDFKIMASTPGTDNETGTGFGLALCNDFVHKNNGEFHIQSNSGKGTSVIFTLPAKQEIVDE